MVSCSSGDELNLDPGAKFSSTKVTFHKSIWSNLVEGVIQYCRVVFDIFSTEKPINSWIPDILATLEKSVDAPE
ncbi:unnamed protein product [Trichobilharzia regenti]|nr:unnamed protein product [Trichobilharzia regenti]